MDTHKTAVSEDDLVPSHIDILHQLAGLKTLSLGWLSTRYKPFFATLAQPQAIASEPFELDTLIIISEDSLAGYDFHAHRPTLLVPAVEGVRRRRRWDGIVSMLKNRARTGKHLKCLVLRGLRVDEDEFEKLNTDGMRRVEGLVDSVTDERLSVCMNAV